MGAPNIQQQLYLKTALNESKDGMFDHPADLDEATKGSHKNVMRLDKAFRKSFDENPKSAETERLAGAASLADKKLDAKELRRGGASERTMRRRINQDKWSEGWGAKNKFEREGQKKRRAALKAKGIAEALEEKLDEGYQAKRLRMFRTRKPFSPEVADFMGRSFKKKRARDARISASAGGVGADTVRTMRRDAHMKAKGIKEKYPLLQITEGSLGLKSVLRKGKHNPRKYGTHMTKNAVRQLAASGRDPNNIKIYGTRGIENFGFQVNANVKREKALKAKGLLPAPKPLSPEVAASAGRIGRLARQRRGMDY